MLEHPVIIINILIFLVRNKIIMYVLRLPRVRASRLSILWGAIDAVSSDKLGRNVLMQTIFLAPLTSSARKR